MVYAFVAAALNSRDEISQDSSGNTIYATTDTSAVTTIDRDSSQGPYDSSSWIGNSSIRYYVMAQTDEPFDSPYPPHNLSVSSGLNSLTVSWSAPNKKDDEGSTTYGLYILGSSS